jgi:hypothetical protein
LHGVSPLQDLGITPLMWADLMRAFDDDVSDGIDYKEFETFLLKAKVMNDRSTAEGGSTEAYGTVRVFR